MFSLKRFYRLLNMDFIYNKRLYLYCFVSIFGVMNLMHLFLRFYYDFSLIDIPVIDGIMFLFFTSSYIVSIYMMFEHYKSIHDSLTSVFYLSLPVSTLERYFFVLFKFLFSLPLFLILCYYLSLNFTVLLDSIFLKENMTDYFSVGLLFKFFKMTYINYLMAFPIFLISRLLFKSYPFLKAVIISVLFYILLEAFFSFVIFFTDNNLFKVIYNFSVKDKGHYLFLFHASSMCFSFLLYFFAYFVLRNLGNLNSRTNLVILLGLISFFSVLFFLLVVSLALLY
ncbi:ABC transporter permease [Borrelia turcica IST7]|uniref:ABC transporter permease n=1 Tax=Borrelia turcica IST7 TaxID=1104446 RepID=A0A386PMW8_9SPIR|nr:ABC transporter permease [Borrelia turcica]AYE36435.1 ABC transporter permease [Borrelia turcica IST7]